MNLCHFCEKIKKIRVRQGLDYYQDLCDVCQRREKIYRTAIKKQLEEVVSP